MKSLSSGDNNNVVLVNKGKKRKATEERSSVKKRKVIKGSVAQTDACGKVQSKEKLKASLSENSREISSAPKQREKKKKSKDACATVLTEEKLQNIPENAQNTKSISNLKKKKEMETKPIEKTEVTLTKKKKSSKKSKSSDQTDLKHSPPEEKIKENLSDTDNSKEVRKTSMMKDSVHQKVKKSKKKNRDKSADKKAKKVLESLLVTGRGKTTNMTSDDCGEDETPEDREVKTVKKPKKKKAKNAENSATDAEAKNQDSKPLNKDLALSYLMTWKNDKDNWSFKKVRQIWLIKNVYDSDAVDNENFGRLLEYLEGAKGGVRRRLLENAQSIHDAAEEHDAGDVKAERAKEILQMLSE